MNDIQLIDENKKVAYLSNLMEYYTTHAAKTFKVCKKKAGKAVINKAEQDVMEKFCKYQKE